MAAFAMASTVNELAGIDSVEFRIKNAAQEGTSTAETKREADVVGRRLRHGVKQ